MSHPSPLVGLPGENLVMVLSDLDGRRQTAALVLIVTFLLGDVVYMAPCQNLSQMFVHLWRRSSQCKLAMALWGRAVSSLSLTLSPPIPRAWIELSAVLAVRLWFWAVRW